MRSQHYTFLFILMFSCLFYSAQTESASVNVEKQFKATEKLNIELYDTLGLPTVEMEIKYHSVDGYSLTIKSDTTLGENLGKELIYSVFEREFALLVQTVLKFKKAVKPTTVMAAYKIAWGLTMPNSSGADAGVLQFNRHIIVLDDYTPKNFDRRQVIDTIINQRFQSAIVNVKNARKIFLDSINRIPALHTYSAAINDGNLTGVEAAISKTDKSSDLLPLYKSYFNALSNYLSLKASLSQHSIYEIKYVEIQFERGYIERIKVWVNYRNNEYMFENIFAIGFSSPKNFRSLAHTKLNIRNIDFDNNPYILLSDVIRNYDNRLANYTRDYSPADTSFKIEPDKSPDIVLHREKYINLIDAKVFTDLKGIRNENPNGLFQIDVNKRFNINTVRYQVGSSRSDVGYFNYMKLFGGLNKIEEKQRELTLFNRNITQNGTIITPNYATNLDLQLYENYHAGALINLGLFDKFDQKYTLYLDFGVKYGHVTVNDSVKSAKNLIPNPKFVPNLHTVTFYIPKLTLEVFSESRINVNFSYGLNYSHLLSNNTAKQIMSHAKSDLTSNIIERKAKFSHAYEVCVKMAPNNNDRTSHLFLRFRLNTQHGDANTSFSQFQVGYAYNWTIAR